MVRIRSAARGDGGQLARGCGRSMYMRVNVEIREGEGEGERQRETREEHLESEYFVARDRVERKGKMKKKKRTAFERFIMPVASSLKCRGDGE